MFVNLLDNPTAHFKIPKWIKKQNIEAILNGAENGPESDDEGLE